MIYLQLLWSFVKIGFTSFGGVSMSALVYQETMSNGWMDLSQLSDIMAIAEMTPGPFGMNCATFAGMQAAGIPGALAATLGVLSPSLTVALLAAVFFNKFKDSTFMQRIMVGIRPACFAMVTGVCVSLLQTNYIVADAISPAALGIGALDALLLMKFNVSIPKVICLSAVLGRLFFGIL